MKSYILIQANHPADILSIPLERLGEALISLLEDNPVDAATIFHEEDGFKFKIHLRRLNAQDETSKRKNEK